MLVLVVTTTSITIYIMVVDNVMEQDPVGSYYVPNILLILYTRDKKEQCCMLCAMYLELFYEPCFILFKK